MGFISKLASKAVTKAAPKAALSLSEQAAEETVAAAPPKLSLVKPKTPSKALKEAEPTPTPTAAAEEPEQGIVLSLAEKMAKQEGIAAQADEFEQVPFYNFPNKAFTDKQYLEAEKALQDSFAMESLFTKLKGNEQKFADELQKKAIKMFGNKDETYELPYNYQSKAKTIDEAVAEVEAAKAQKPVEFTGEEDIPPPIERTKSIFSGKLGSSKSMLGSKVNQILEDIRQLREQNYKELLSMRQAQGFDEPVLEIALGEFRHKYGYEYDPIIRKDNKRIVDLMNEKQKEYDVLKKRYADTPDITIYHGGSREKIASIEREGFRRPSLSKRTAQQELNTGATSMTTDIALNFNPSTGFGGGAENILETKMPYADYVFTRVNMKPSEYKGKDLDATARTITGSPTGVRALRLPRSSGFYETESAFIESDKMKMSKNVDELQQKRDVYQKIREEKLKLQDEINNIDANRYNKPFDKKLAVQTYDTIRKYLQNEAKLGRISNVRSGIGEQYEQDMSSLFYRSEMLKDLRAVLDDSGMSEKAYNVSKLIDLAKRGMNESDFKRQMTTYLSEIEDAKAKLGKKYQNVKLDELVKRADNRDPEVRDFDTLLASLNGILESNNLSSKNYTLDQILKMAQPENRLGSDLLELTDKFNRGGLVRRK